MARPRQVSDDEILRAARAVFLEHGPGAATQEIADAVGLSQPALFRRFGTKNQLMLRALLPDGVPPWTLRAEEGPSAGVDGRAQLRDLLLGIDGFFTEFAPCMATLRASPEDMRVLMSGFAEPPPIRSQRVLAEWLAKADALGLVRPIDAHSVAIALIGAIQGRVMLHYMVGLQAGENYVDTVLDVFWGGIAPVEVA